MSAADYSLASLKSMESKGATGLAKAATLCLLGVSAVLPKDFSDVTIIVYNFGMTHGACSQVSEITSPTARPAYVPKTTLGKKLFALRQRAIGRGTTLLTENQIIEEVMRRRGDVPDAEV